MEVKLTEQEFDVIIEALDNLPNKGDAGKLIAKMLATSLCKGDEEAKKKMEIDMANQELKEEAERKERKRVPSIIIGKLYMMKDNIVEPPVPFNIQEMTRE
ncbi:MAG: hypothetical protein IJ456_08510 [Bacteroides sp.]|nr:hypothetical protein [Bacteroides sp.]